MGKNNIDTLEKAEVKTPPELDLFQQTQTPKPIGLKTTSTETDSQRGKKRKEATNLHISQFSMT